MEQLKQQLLGTMIELTRLGRDPVTNRGRLNLAAG